MNFVRIHRVVVEYTASKTRRSFLFIVLFVLCLLTIAIWKMDSHVRRPVLSPSSLFDIYTTNIGTDQPNSVVLPTPVPFLQDDNKSNIKTKSINDANAEPTMSTTTALAPPTTKTSLTTVAPPPKVGTVTISAEELNKVTTEKSLMVNVTPNRTLVYIRPFPYLIYEEDLCTTRYPNLFVLIYVHTAPGNFEQRNLIRDTWGSKNLYFRLRMATIFVLGRTLDEAVAAKIKEESQRHHDIIQEDFLDAYKNLTYKGVAALRWISSHCMTPKFVLKVDDDMLVNTFEIVRFLRKAYMKKPEGNKFLCLFYNRNMPVMRDKKSKWYVSEQDYPDKMYLPYCSGSAYIFPTSVIPKLYNVSFTTPFFWVDDVYVTGLLAEAANITHQRIDQLYILYRGQDELAENIVFGSKVFGHFNRRATLEWRHEFWKNITDIEQWRA